MKRIRKVPKVIQLKNKQRWDDSLKIRKISDVDAAYIAGFVDGEGCITLYKVDTSPSGYAKHTFRVKVTNTFPGILEWISLTVGYGPIHTRKAHGNYKQAWEWGLTGRRAIDFLKQIYPYLKVKRLQAEVAFEYEKTISCPGQQKLTPEVVEIRNGLKKELSGLNN